MDTPQLEFVSPKTLILAARGDTSSFSHEKDQVWELEFNDHNDHPISLRTTYGLRAREMQLFPAFTIDNKPVTALRDYSAPPEITRYLPDAFRVQCMPAYGLLVQWDGYLPNFDTLVGTIMMSNTGSDPISITLSLLVLLVPMRKGTPMHPDKDGINQIITGQSGELSPVLFMTGGPNAIISPFPALVVPVKLDPGQSRRLTWALVTKDSPKNSLAAARRISAVDWKAAVREKSLEQEHRTLRIKTGDPDWDTALFLSQIQAETHYLSSESGSRPVFLRFRLPDETIPSESKTSFTDDLTVLEAQHLFQVLAPSNISTIPEILDSFRERIDEDGVLSSRLFSTVQNKPIRECPLLARLHLNLYEVEQNLNHLEKAFPDLCRGFDSWFMGEDGPDYEQPPVWDDPRQCQCDTGLFQFDIWEETGQGLDIGWTLSPALLALLSGEASALSQIAKLIKDKAAQKKFNEIRKSLHNQIQSTWNENLAGFSTQDLQSRQVPERELFFPGRIQPKLEINKIFLHAQRLQLHLTSSDENTRVCRLTISGTDPDGQPIQEIIKTHQVRWVMGKAHLTTEHCFQSLESLTIEGLKAGDRFLLETADFSQPDITCLLPLWSGDVTGDQCKILLEKCLDPETKGHSFGIPETWEAGHDLPRDLSIKTNILWNTLIITGLMKAGYQDIAAGYFTRMMTAVLNGLRRYNGFFSFYDTHSGQPTGARNALAGLVPVRLFLSLAGIRIFSPRNVAVWGQNPFPWPVEVHWQGLSVRREASETLIVFPDGSRHTGATEKPLVFTMKPE